MRLLFVHVDRVAVEPTERALDASVSADDDAGEDQTADATPPESLTAAGAVLAFAAVETVDATAEAAVAVAGADAVTDVAEHLRAETVVLVPEPALSARAAEPEAARSAFDSLRAAIVDAALDVQAVPFGWRRRLDVATKAHRFATQVRTIDPDDSATRTGGEEDVAAGVEWTVVTPTGDRTTLSRFVDEADPSAAVERALRATVDALEHPGGIASDHGKRDGTGAGDDVPDRGERALALGVADRDPLAGGARWYPVGTFLRETLADAVQAASGGDGAMAVASPSTVDLADPAVRAYAASLGDRGHGVAVDGHRVLPDELGCASAFATLADLELDADDLPLRLFDREATAPGKRSIGRGDLGRTSAGFADGVAPTVHVAFGDDAAARDAVATQARRALALAEDCGLDALAVCRVTDAFDAANPEWVAALASVVDAPLLYAVDSGSLGPSSIRVDVSAVTGRGNAHRTGSVGLDAASARHFDATLDVGGGDGDGDEPAHPTVVQAALAGGLDATVAALVDSEGPLPAWLAPTQVRLVPVADDHVARCEAIADDLEASDRGPAGGVRVDVDDRSLSVADRLAHAARDRVPYWVVVGDDETLDSESCTEADSDGSLPVTDAATGRERDRSVPALAAVVADAVDSTVAERSLHRAPPQRPLPRLLSRRPTFGGER